MKIPIALAAVAFLAVSGAASADGGRSSYPASPSVLEWKFLDANQLNCTIASDGPYCDHRRTNTSGLEWPKGTGKTPMFTAGIWIAGVHVPSGLVRMSNLNYRAEYQPGPLLETFNTTTNDDAAPVSRASDPRYRIYKIEKKTEWGDYTRNVDAWSEWPGDLGAPFEDRNGNGSWDPGIDLPKFYGDQQMWCVFNDASLALHQWVSLGVPLGLEIQVLYWSVNDPGTLGNTMFARWWIINKSDADYSNVYLSLWEDPDLGEPSDDLPGCDTLQSLGYVYNGKDNDATYGTQPPALGIRLLRGPIVPGEPADVARFGEREIAGAKNLGPSSFTVSTQVMQALLDPPLGSSQYQSVAYDYMQGKAGTIHQYIIRPGDGSIMKHFFSGDPVAGTGDLPANFPLGAFNAQDVRIMLNCGPFSLAKGDTQEVVGALIMSQGADRLNSVTRLKTFDAPIVDQYFNSGLPIAGIEPLNPYYPVNSPVTILGSASVQFGTITSMEWVLAQKPTGSSAQPIPPSGPTTTITPDIPGPYTVWFVVTSNGGLKDTGEVTFLAAANQRPVAEFQVPTQVTLGDTIVMDGSAISDPDGDPITVKWTVDGGPYYSPSNRSVQDLSMGLLADSSSTMTWYYPYRCSRFTIMADVRDPYYRVVKTKSVVVVPIASLNMLVKSVLDKLYLPWVAYYGLGPMREFDGTFWCSAYGNVFTPYFRSNGPAQAYQTSSVSNFFVAGNRISAARGIGGVELMQTDGHRNVLAYNLFAPLHPRTSADTTVSDVFYRAPYLFFSYGVEGIWVYDVTDLYNPAKVTQFTDGNFWGNFVVVGNLLYGLNYRVSQMRVVDITDPFSMTVVKTVDLSAGYTTVKQVGQRLYLVRPDTVAVYDISSPTDPALQTYWTPPQTFVPNNRFYDVAGKGTYVIVGTHEGSYIYDVANISSPTIYGKYVSGFAHTRTFMNQDFVVSGQWDWQNPGYPERLEGLIEFATSLTSTQPPVESAPVAFNLAQNFPNPFNPETVIRVQIAVSSRVTLTIYDVLGREVNVLMNEKKGPGNYEITFDASGLASGVYLYRLRSRPLEGGQAAEFVQTRKMILVR